MNGLVIVLQKRRAHRKAADLITLGYEGRIRWWISNDHRLVWTATIRNKKDELYCMGVNTENTILVTGYSSGAVTVWDISGTCVDASELSKSMTLLSSFHAHSSCVMSIDVLSERQLILTGSRDHTVALFDVIRCMN
jgi:WD40 repeat protein